MRQELWEQRIGTVPENTPVKSVTLTVDDSLEDKLRKIDAVTEDISGLELPEEFDETDELARLEVSLAIEEIERGCRESLDFLASLATPDMYKYAFPPLYVTLWQLIRAKLAEGRSFPQVALGLPRGFAKTAVIKLVLLYIILFTKKRFILVLCENEEKAKAIISDVIDMLNEDNIRAAFGDWDRILMRDTQTLKMFGFRGRNIVIRGAGAGTGIRGITIKNRRPDVMLFDDIQSKEDAKSEVLAEALEEWMIGTAMKAKDPEGCLYLFLANMYPYKGSLLRRLKQNPEWIKYIVGGILQDGSSLWEELHPIAQLQREFRNDLSAGKPEIFYAEVLNDENATANQQLNLSALTWPYVDGEMHAGNFVIIDPSGNKAKSDHTSVMYGEILNAKPCAIDLEEGRMSPLDTIKAALKFAFQYKCKHIFIEDVAYQASLAFWFEYVCQQVGIDGIEAIPLQRPEGSKNSVIMRSFLSLSRAEIFVKPHTTLHAKYSIQVMYFDQQKTTNDDGILDCVSLMQTVQQEYGHVLASSLTWEMQEFANIDVNASNVNF